MSDYFDRVERQIVRRVEEGLPRSTRRPSAGGYLAVVATSGKSVASQLPSPSPAVMDISQGNGSAAPGQLAAGCVSLRQALALARSAGAGHPRRTEYLGRLGLSVPTGVTILQAASP